MVSRRPPSAIAGSGELAAVPMLADVAGRRLGELAAAHPVRRFPAGAVLLRQGVPAAWLLIVLRGQVSAVTDHHDGSRSRYPLMPAPCVIDKPPVLAGQAYPATWTAAADVHALTLSAGEFRALLGEQRLVREHVLRYLAIQVGQSRAALAARGPAGTRIARWLLAASSSGGQPFIRLPAGQQGIAEELGLSRVTVNRELRHLARAGAILTRPGAVILLDASKLTAITSEPASGTPP